MSDQLLANVYITMPFINTVIGYEFVNVDNLAEHWLAVSILDDWIDRGRSLSNLNVGGVSYDRNLGISEWRFALNVLVRRLGIYYSNLSILNL